MQSTDDGFAQWVREARDTGPVLDTQSYADLVKPSKAVAPFTYRAVAADLFSGIVNTASARTTIRPNSFVQRRRGPNDESPWQA